MKRNKTFTDTRLSNYPPRPTLGQRLEKCAMTEAHPFTQIDGYANEPVGEGDTFMVGLTWEQVRHRPTVRLLIPQDTNIADLIQVLKKAVKEIKRNPHYLKWPPPPPPAPEEPLPF